LFVLRGENLKRFKNLGFH